MRPYSTKGEIMILQQTPLRFVGRSAFVLMLSICFLLTSHGQRQRSKDLDENRTPSFRKTSSTFDRGIGFLDAGKMQVNGVENYGMIGHRGFPYTKHGFWGELRWVMFYVAVPPGPWGANIKDGTGAIVDRSMNYNVVESITSRLSGSGRPTVAFSDWEAVDNGAIHNMGSAQAASGEPLLATSTQSDSWPEGYFDESGDWVETPGERHWPGKWALDPNPESPTYGQPVEGQFVSSKDIFFVMDDKYNSVRPGDEVDTGYPLGFDVRASLYSYSAPIYEDIVFFNYDLIFRDDITDPDRQHWNGPIDSVYVGFMIDPDLPGRSPTRNTMDPWAEDDYAIFDTLNNVFIMFDKDGYDRDDDDDNDEGPVSAYAIAYLKTPTDAMGNPIGQTGFHFFDQTVGPEATSPGDRLERIYYAMASGKKEILGQVDQQIYFHGPNVHFDDIDSLRNFQEQHPPYGRPDVWFYISSGPFSISPGDTIPIHFAIIGGKDNPGPLDADGFPANWDDSQDRFADVYTNLQAALDLYGRNFQGAGPPATPLLTAAGTKVIDENGLPVIYTTDNMVHLYWDDRAEHSTDLVSKAKDFEGYRIYKGLFNRNLIDRIDWGTEILANDGTTIIGYVPAFEVDLDNTWSGPDPLDPNTNLGSNTGIVHEWTDTDVVPGLRYRYAITAYDHPDTLRGLQSNESTIGKSPKILNFVDVIPGTVPPGFVSAKVDTSVVHVSGVATGELHVRVVDDAEVTGHTYTVTISMDSTTGQKMYSVYDEDEQKFKITDSPKIARSSLGETADGSPFIEGIGLGVVDHDQIELWFSQWQTAAAETSNFRVTLLGARQWARPSDYEIRFLSDITVTPPDTLSYQPVDTSMVGNNPGTKTFPFQVWNVSSEPPEQVDVFPSSSFRPTWTSGDVLTFLELRNPGDPVKTQTWQAVISWSPDTTQPETIPPRPPVVSDVLDIFTKKPFIPGEDVYQFTTESASVDLSLANVEGVRVVPNPYIVTHQAELFTGDPDLTKREVRFINLPPECTIDIYTLTGDHIQTIHHESMTYGEERWDLLSKENLDLSYGIYIYVVKTPDGQKKIDKFFVIK